jgi:hypothetical protein
MAYGKLMRVSSISSLVGVGPVRSEIFWPKSIFMRNRLSSYFLIAAGAVFMAVQGFAIVKHVRLQTSPTTPDYINAVKIVIALIAIVVAIRSLARDEKDGVPAQAPIPTSPPRLDWWRFALAAMLLGTVLLAIATVSRHQKGGPAAAPSLLFFGSSVISFFAYRWHCLRLELANGRFSLDKYRGNPQRYFRGPPGLFAFWFSCTMAITIGIAVFAAPHR